jgi:hypothetical protein
MTPWIAFGIGLSVGILLTIVSLAICEAINRKQRKDEPYSCNCGLTDEEAKEALK